MRLGDVAADALHETMAGGASSYQGRRFADVTVRRYGEQTALDPRGDEATPHHRLADCCSPGGHGVELTLLLDDRGGRLSSCRWKRRSEAIDPWRDAEELQNGQCNASGLLPAGGQLEGRQGPCQYVPSEYGRQPPSAEMRLRSDPGKAEKHHHGRCCVATGDSVASGNGCTGGRLGLRDCLPTLYHGRGKQPHKSWRASPSGMGEACMRASGLAWRRPWANGGVWVLGGVLDQ
ncbi:hypothetical protein F5X68DRAFT_199247 [Plectosphaerella plurivora]|uniref:Uncharacterized protein n=1 Tax=Plectosphaerella plurivora TaxID=936078 RepID=A0A9P8VH43_9PEZI|nr:hypothetical protein F5X68DRAFT_199247 [Plectosphaerella plurivora]